MSYIQFISPVTGSDQTLGKTCPVFDRRMTVQSLVTAWPICDEDTDTTNDDSEEEIIEEFGSSDDTSNGELHPQLITTTRSRRVAGSWRNMFI